MTQLQHAALGCLPLDEDEVEKLYKAAGPSHWTIKRLCESHERLRAELQGAMIMLDKANPPEC